MSPYDRRLFSLDELPPHDGPVRSFEDEAGTLWLVHERRSMRDDHSIDVSLICQNSTTIRRVRRYPANWHQLTPEALEEVCRGL
jgi:hypothetical protein